MIIIKVRKNKVARPFLNSKIFARPRARMAILFSPKRRGPPVKNKSGLKRTVSARSHLQINQTTFWTKTKTAVLNFNFSCCFCYGVLNFGRGYINGNSGPVVMESIDIVQGWFRWILRVNADTGSCTDGYWSSDYDWKGN